MKITYDHYFGSQEKHNLQLYHANLQCEPHEEREALENGWLWYNGEWYQSRSTRIVLKDWKYLPKMQDFKLQFTDTPQLEEYNKIWNFYLNARAYPRIYDPFLKTDRDMWMEFYWQNELQGFTKFVQYNGGLESQFNFYIPYPQWKIGQEMLMHEAQYAQSLGLEHLYIGSGYEKSSVYKAHLNGFQWWNGVEWSGDKNEYIELCKRDSTVISLADLSNIANK
jgi:hypothetical protein